MTINAQLMLFYITSLQNIRMAVYYYTYDHKHILDTFFFANNFMLHAPYIYKKQISAYKP